jgi:hypothetical protein
MQHSVGDGTALRYPIRAIGDFCAAKTSAQVNTPAAPASNVMNSRRLMAHLKPTIATYHIQQT